MQFNNVTQIALFAHGQRGIIYKGMYKGKTVAIKTARSTSRAIGNIGREGKWLQKINNEGIGPTLLYCCEDYFIYEFVEGMFLPAWIVTADKKDVLKVLMNALEQCRTLDRLKINKEEMHHPFKHIIIQKNNTPVFIDFERCRYVLNPQNVTQFVQYLCHGLQTVLRNKKILIDTDRLEYLAQEYKQEYNKTTFNIIIKVLHELQ